TRSTRKLLSVPTAICNGATSFRPSTPVSACCADKFDENENKHTTSISFFMGSLSPVRNLLNVDLVVRQNVERFELTPFDLVIQVDLHMPLLPGRLYAYYGNLVLLRVWRQTTRQSNRIKHGCAIFDFVHARGLDFAEYRYLWTVDFLDNDSDCRLRYELRISRSDFFLEFLRCLSARRHF